jgi:hypothetical protein
MAPGGPLSAPVEPPRRGPGESWSEGPPANVESVGPEAGGPAAASRDGSAPRSGSATLALVAGAVVVGVLCLLDWLPALYAAVVLAHLWIASRWRRKGATAALEEIRVAPTPVGILVLGLLWVLLLFAVFLPSAPFRLLACLLFACACAAWPLAARNVARARVSRRVPARARVGVPTGLEIVARNPTRRAAEALRVEDDLGLVARPAAIEAAVETLGAGAEDPERVGGVVSAPSGSPPPTRSGSSPPRATPRRRRRSSSARASSRRPPRSSSDFGGAPRSRSAPGPGAPEPRSSTGCASGAKATTRGASTRARARGAAPRRSSSAARSPPAA